MARWQERLTFYPHQDSAGNNKPGDFGAVLDQEGTYVQTSISYAAATERYGEMERAEHDIPLTVEGEAS